jgi:hypothetical protein
MKKLSVILIGVLIVALFAIAPVMAVSNHGQNTAGNQSVPVFVGALLITKPAFSIADLPMYEYGNSWSYLSYADNPDRPAPTHTTMLQTENFVTLKAMMTITNPNSRTIHSGYSLDVTFGSDPTPYDQKLLVVKKTVHVTGSLTTSPGTHTYTVNVPSATAVGSVYTTYLGDAPGGSWNYAPVYSPTTWIYNIVVT